MIGHPHDLRQQREMLDRQRDLAPTPQPGQMRIQQPDVAAAAGLTRSKTVGVLNIAALKDGKGQAAKVSGTLKNLLGQTSELKFKQVLESGAVYYLAEFPLRQREMLTFSIQVQIGDAAPHTLTFNQEVFPDE